MQDRVPVDPGRVLITPENGAAPYYATMARADNPTQEGTPLNKANLLKDATAALYGLDASAVPDDVLAWLGKYNLHWWKRSEDKSPYGYVEVRTLQESRMYWDIDHSSSGRYPVNVSYSDSIVIDQSTGAVSLNDPSTITLINQEHSNSELNTQITAFTNAVRGKYLLKSDVIYYVNADATITGNDYSDDDTGEWYEIEIKGGHYYKVSSQRGVVEIAEEYVSSADREAYPNGGVSDGYVYEYLGVPTDNVISAPKMVIGSYVGGGVVTTLTLHTSFAPKLLIVMPESDLTLSLLIAVKGVNYNGDNTNSGSSTSVVDYTWGESSVSWTTSNTTETMYNEANRLYHYIIFG